MCPQRLTPPKNTIDVPALKESIDPFDFYQRETVNMCGTGRRGGWITAGLCPFHDDKRPGTFKFKADTGRYRCFSCRAHGDYIDFVRARYDIDFRRAAEYLMHEYGKCR